MTHSHSKKFRGNRGTQGLYFYKPGKRPPQPQRKLSWWNRLYQRVMRILREK